MKYLVEVRFVDSDRTEEFLCEEWRIDATGFTLTGFCKSESDCLGHLFVPNHGYTCFAVFDNE